MKHMKIIAFLIALSISPIAQLHAGTLKKRASNLEQRTRKLACSHHRMWKELRRLHEELNQIKKKICGSANDVDVTSLDQEV